jgi:hypothetical protein
VRRAWLWVVAGLLVASLLAVWIILRMRGKKSEANRTMADVVDAWSAPRVDAARTKLTQLKGQLGAQEKDVKAAETEVAKLRDELRSKYQVLELSPEEMEQRLSGLRV